MKISIKQGVLAGAVFGFASAFAGTGTVAVTGTNVCASAAVSLTVSFAGHAHATNGLWIAWDEMDRGGTTNGWAHVEFVRTVTPDLVRYEYPLPEGWGGTGKKAMRFFLSEVPYDVDCTYESITSDGNQYLIPGHTLTGAAKVEMDFSLTELTGTHPILCSRKGTDKNQFTLFAVQYNSTTWRWRFDYNTLTGSASTNYRLLDAKTRYCIRADATGVYYADGKCAHDQRDKPFSGPCDGPLTIMAHHTGDVTNPSAKTKMTLYGFKVTDGAYVVDFVPARKNGVIGLFDRLGGVAFIGPSGSGTFAPGMRREAADPFFAASDVVGAIPAPAGDRILFRSDFEMSSDASYATGAGGEKAGSGLLTLTGENDFGGTFTVSGGALAADFGRGLGATDNLTLTEGCYAGLNGMVTAALGTGPGEINLAGGAVGFTTAAGALTVNLGGAKATVTVGVPGANASPLVLNDALGVSDLTLLNPLACADSLTVDNEAGRTFLKGDVTVGGQVAKQGKGLLVFEDVTVDAGNLEIVADGGTLPVLMASNANVRAETTTEPAMMIKEGSVEFANSSFAAKQSVYVGVASHGNSTYKQLVLQNSTFDIGDNPICLQDKSETDSLTRFMVYGDDSVVRASQVCVDCGEFQVYGGTVLLSDDRHGVEMGVGSEACRLYGGVLVAKGVSCGGGGPAFEWRGGTVRATATVDSFFLKNASKTRVGTAGGVFDSQDYRITITKPLTPTYDSSAVTYSRETCMSVPAFRKDGSGALALAEASTYYCATEAHEGELKIKLNGALPSAGLLRLTGGTFNENELDRTVGNLVGHGVIIGGGTLTVTGEIVPIGGNIALHTTKLVGKVCLPVAADGTLPSALEARTAADLSGVDLVVENAANLPASGRIRLLAGAVSKPPKSVTGLPADWHVTVSARGVSASNGGLLIFIR